MKRIHDPQAIADWVRRSPHSPVLETLKQELTLLAYEKGELVTSPLLQERWFQVVVQGSLNIYFVRDDGGRYSLSSGNSGYILGDMDLFESCTGSSIYTEAAEPLFCLGLPIGQNREALLNNPLFLQMICRSLTAKMEAITTLDAAPCSLSQLALFYLRFRCRNGVLKGVERTAFRLHCSPRQLQRILNRFEQEGIAVKIGKGAYRLTKQGDQTL